MVPKKIIKIPMPTLGVDVDISDYLDIIETQTFQRLREVKQLGPVYLIFPGATHTRFEHSLGAFHIARRIASILNLNRYNGKLIEVSALLHDIAHGPYSHVSEIVLEEIFKLSHNEKAIEKLNKLRDELGKKGIDFEKKHEISFEDLLKVFNREHSLWKLIWSLLGADKLDYLPRDYFKCGFGIPETDRIISYLCFENGEYGVDEKAKEVLKDYIYQWWLAHREITLRKSCQIPSAMMQRAIYYAIEDGFLEPAEVWDLTDWELNAKLDSSKTSIGKQLFDRIKTRNLLKTVVALKRHGYGEVERIAEKPIFLDEISNQEYEDITKKYDRLDKILELDRRLANELGLKEGDVIACLMPEIKRLESPERVRLYFQSERNFKLTIFEVYPRFLDLLLEEMRAQYAIRIAVPLEQRKTIYRVFSEKKLDAVDFLLS